MTTTASPLAFISTVTSVLDKSDVSRWKLKYFVVPIYCVVCLVGSVGNAMVIYIMQARIRQKSITDIYVTNLAFADFIFLSMLPFWTIDLAMDNRWVFGRALCKLTSGSTHVHMYASVFFLAAMSVDRLLAVVYFQRSQRLRTRRRAKVGSAFIWMFAAVISLVPFFFRDQDFLEQTGYNKCVWTFSRNGTMHNEWFAIHFISRFVIGFVLPCIIIAVCYTTIAIFLKTRKTRGKLTSKRQDRATVLVLTVIALFIFCWLPNQISNAVYSLQAFQLIGESHIPTVHYYIHMISTTLAWSHSCFNPFLYVVMREDLKLKMTEILHSALICCCGNTVADRLLTSKEATEKALHEATDCPRGQLSTRSRSRKENEKIKTSVLVHAVDENQPLATAALEDSHESRTDDALENTKLVSPSINCD